MLNIGTKVDPALLDVAEFSDDRLKRSLDNGVVNTDEEVILANIASSIRRGHQQLKPCGPRPDQVLLVGSGPSLKDTERELVDRYFAGGKIVALNGAYRWCLERNLRPSVHIVIDARPENAAFVHLEVPRCQYVYASQCAPELWDAVEGRENVWIAHTSGSEGRVRELLDAYYQGQWAVIAGGVTVATRALFMLRYLGYCRFDLFGIDSCWMGGAHHAFEQKLNDADKWFSIDLGTIDGQGERTFRVSGWHLAQFQDFLQMIRIHGDLFHLTVHGNGLIAHAMQILGSTGELPTVNMCDAKGV
jgi:hypothetical protein